MNLNQVSRRFWVLAVLSILVFGVAYGPLSVRFFAYLWSRPHYQYFPFVMGAFVWLVWQRCSQAVDRRAWSEEKDPTSTIEDNEAEDQKRGTSYDERAMDPQPSPLSKRAGMGAAAWAVLTLAWIVLAFAYLAQSPWLAYVSAIGVVTCIFLVISRYWYVPYLWGVWLLLWLVVPLPFDRDQLLISMLQRTSSKISSVVLDLFRIPHLMEGNTLILSDKQFFVDEACSGIVSVMSIIACALIYGVWRNRPPVHLFVLAAAGMGWATLMNVLRISVIAIVYYWNGVDWSTGTPHEILGLVIFLLTFLALVSTDYALLVLLAPIRETYSQRYGDLMKFGTWLVTGWDRLQSLGRPFDRAAAESPALARYGEETTKVAVVNSSDGISTKASAYRFADRLVLAIVPLVAFGLLSTVQFVTPNRFQQPSAKRTQSLARAKELRADVLPKSINGLTQAEFEAVDRSENDIFGDHSRTFEYRNNEGKALIVSCDFPFGPLWHDLTLCYLGIGWELTSHRTIESSILAEEGDEWGLVEATFSKPDGTRAYLTYCVFDDRGQHLSPPSIQNLDSFWQVFLQQFGAGRPGLQFQVQVWTTTVGQVPEERRQAARELLLDVREILRRSVTDSTEETIDG